MSKPELEHVTLDSSFVFGYHTLEEFSKNDWKPKGLRSTIYLINVFNGASILLSPLTGIIRIVGALFLCIYVNCLKILGLNYIEKESPDLERVNRFCTVMFIRGVLEVLCLGIILGTVVDGVVTLKNHQMCCFKKA